MCHSSASAVDKRMCAVAYVHVSVCTHCCLVLDGTAENSITFTRLCRCVHPTNTWHLDCFSIFCNAHPMGAWTDHSTVFTRWHQCAPASNMWFNVLTEVCPQMASGLVQLFLDIPPLAAVHGWFNHTGQDVPIAAFH